MDDKKNVAVVGAGIAGLTAGIYALNNGFNVTIYEKGHQCGGQCTGWTRQGVFIDGCAHWIVGTNPEGQLYKLWNYVGAFSSDVTIHQEDYFNKFDVDGEIVTIYSDLDKLEKELLRIGPEDKKVIRRFIRAIKGYRHVCIPTDKPMDEMNVFDYIAMGWKMFPMLPYYMKYTHVTIHDFSEDCKSELLKKTFRHCLKETFNLHSLLYVLQAFSKRDAGMPMGGSLNIAKRMEKKFLSLGGKIEYLTPVQKVQTQGDRAVGIVTKNGFTPYDYIISTADEYHTLYTLLEGKFHDDYYERRLNDREGSPLSLCCLACYKVDKKVTNIPRVINIPVTPFSIGKKTYRRLSIRSHSFDETLNKDCYTVTVMMEVEDDVYDTFKKMEREEYLAEKERIGNTVRDIILSYFGLNEEDITLLDVTTPLTYERYTNGYRGSYMSFITTHKSKGLMNTGRIEGLKNFFLAGQWIMPPGGMPIALFTGKHAAFRIAKAEGKKFVDEKN